MSTPRMIEVAGAALNVVESGHAEGFPLALVNGAQTNIHMWEPILPRLEERFRVIRHDTRGTGESGPGAREEDYAIPRYGDDVADLLNALGIERAILCGLAFGARVALQAAVRHPARFSLLVLLDATVFAPASLETRNAGNEEAKRLREAAGLPETVRDRAWFHQKDKETARRAIRAASGQGDQSHVLPLVTMPTLLATGRQDPNLTGTTFMAEHIADCEFHVIEMCGHGSVIERPDAVGDLMVDYLARRL